MKKRLLSLTLIISVGAVVFCSEAQARELVVTDCQGRTRAVGTVEKGEHKVVEARFAQELSGLSASLKDSSSGKTVTAEASEGIANFDNIGAGTWALCFNGELGNLRKVIIKDEGSNTAAIGLGVLGGAGAILAATLSDDDSSSETKTVSNRQVRR